MAERKKGNTSETLDKGLKILNLYCGEKATYSLSEISRCLGINKTSIFRFVNTLCEHGYLQPEHDRTTLDRRAIEQELQETRARGYSFNRETFLPGLIAIGAPIFNLRTAKVVGGVSFDSSTARYTMEAFEKQYATLLVELAKKISAALSV